MCYFLFVNRDADRGHNPSISVSLKGCEITPDIHIGSGKYGIKMSVPSTDGMSDLWVRLWLYICTSNILVIAAAEQLGPGTQNKQNSIVWDFSKYLSNQIIYTVVLGPSLLFGEPSRAF